MTRVLILGANGQLARNTTRVFLEKTDVALTLYLRRASRLRNPDPVRVKIVEGDVLDAVALRAAMQSQDAVYANLAGDMARQTRAIIDAVHSVGLKRLIFVSSMGIYGEVPGETYPASWTRIGTRRLRSRNRTWTILSSDRAGSRTTRESAPGSRKRVSPSQGTTFRSTVYPT
jgi:nucleoside-diphosphate-sugar epimerase